MAFPNHGIMSLRVWLSEPFSAGGFQLTSAVIHHDLMKFLATYSNENDHPSEEDTL